MNHSDPALELEGVTKRYGDVEAVSGLDLEVERGEIFGFLGPNGAGKSTTIKILLDQARATEGTARVLGLDSRADAVEVHRRVGYVPGDLALYPSLTGEQTLRYFARLRGGGRAGVDWHVVTSLADRFDADLSKRVRDYSTGNRQKVGLIQAFMHRPEMLVLDEPNAGLDPLVQQSFHELLREVRDEGTTVFLSSHTLSEVERVAGRVGIIRRGELAAVETITDLKAKAVRRLELDFGGAVGASEFEQLDGVHDVEVDDGGPDGGSRVELAFDGSIQPVLEVAMRHDLRDLHTRDADLEEIFLAYYRGDAVHQDDDGDGKDGNREGAS